MNALITEFIDVLFEGTRDGVVNREMFGKELLRFADTVMNSRVRQAVIDNELAQTLLTARNLPRC